MKSQPNTLWCSFQSVFRLNYMYPSVAGCTWRILRNPCWMQLQGNICLSPHPAEFWGSAAPCQQSLACLMLINRAPISTRPGETQTDAWSYCVAVCRIWHQQVLILLARQVSTGNRGGTTPSGAQASKQEVAVSGVTLGPNGNTKSAYLRGSKFVLIHTSVLFFPSRMNYVCLENTKRSTCALLGLLLMIKASGEMFSHRRVKLGFPAFKGYVQLALWYERR